MRLGIRWAAAVLVASTGALARPSFNLLDLGAAAGEGSAAVAVSTTGLVLINTPAGPEVYDAVAGALVSPPTGDPRMSGAAINAAGDYAGSYAAPGGNMHAFLRTADGAFTDLGTLGGTTSAAWALNDNGLVAGDSTTPSNESHAFVWSAGTLYDLGGGWRGRARGINNSGVAAGYVTASVTYGTYDAVTFSNSVATKLPTLGGLTSLASAIDDAGDVAGGASVPGNTNLHAALWTSGAVIDLGQLPNDAESFAAALDAQGEVVGWSDRFDAGRAFFWNGVLYDLNDLVGAHDLPLTRANGINAGFVVGLASDGSTGRGHAYVAQRAADVADECDALVPANIGPGITARVGAEAQNITCAPPDSDDGAGSTALGYVTYPSPMFDSGIRYSLFDGAGAIAGSLSGPPLERFFSQPSGFTGVTSEGTRSQLLSWSHGGVLLAQRDLSTGLDERVTAQVMPGGGTAAVHTSPVDAATCAAEYLRFDPQGQLAAGPAPLYTEPRTAGSPCLAPLLGVDLAGNTLALRSDGPRQIARWIGADGSSLTNDFAVPLGGVSLLRFLPDGSLVGLRRFGENGRAWDQRFPDAQPVVTNDAPAFLARFNPYDFWLVRGGAAFLVPPQQGTSDVLVSVASGRVCGTIPTTGKAGRDGTVIRQDYICGYHFWPQLLR